MSNEFEATVLAELRDIGKTLSRIDKEQSVTKQAVIGGKTESDTRWKGHDEMHHILDRRLEHLEADYKKLSAIADQGKGALYSALKIGGAVAALGGFFAWVIKLIMRGHTV